MSVSWEPAAGRFIATGRNGISIPVNAPHEGGGANGFSAADLLLAAAGSCSAWDVVEILHKQRQEVTAVHVRVEGQQAADPPWNFEEIELSYVVRGRGLNAAGARRAVELSVEKYCSVLATVRGVAHVRWSMEVEESTAAEAEAPSADKPIDEPQGEAQATAP